jgi:colanic acid/amylovoran biosynthesis glycosyltransferase
VQPSYGDAEGTPNTILEASAAALPVVSTKHAGIPQAIIDGVTGLLVDEYDAKSMTDVMVRLFNDKTLCQTMGAVGRSHIQLNYNIERHIGVLEDQLNMAINNKK